MKERVLRRAGGWRRWSLLGLLLILAFLSHDVAIASDLLHPADAARQIRPASSSSVADATVRPDHFAPSDAPESSCNADRDASRTSARDRDYALRSTSGAYDSLVDLSADARPAELTAPPPLPAGLRRALLQVFLI